MTAVEQKYKEISPTIFSSFTFFLPSYYPELITHTHKIKDKM